MYLLESRIENVASLAKSNYRLLMEHSHCFIENVKIYELIIILKMLLGQPYILILFQLYGIQQVCGWKLMNLTIIYYLIQLFYPKLMGIDPGAYTRVFTLLILLYQKLLGCSIFYILDNVNFMKQFYFQRVFSLSVFLNELLRLFWAFTFVTTMDFWNALIMTLLFTLQVCACRNWYSRVSS